MLKNIKQILDVVAIPVLYALLLRALFGLKEWHALFSVMTISFLLLAPFIIGILTVYLSSLDLAKSFVYRIFMPWVSVLVFFVMTLIFALEGWACWFMVLPLFLPVSSLGGLLGGYMKLNQRNKLQVSLLVLLPFFAAPIENWIGSIPATYRAYTYIDIAAPAEKIWQNVTRVQEIPKEQDTGWLTQFLGFPRPVKAELNYEGVGAYREAVFTNGLVFHETVKDYKHLEKMTFSIKAYPHEIPSTTLDEHVVIGGKYFDVLEGTYQLEKLNESLYRLHLYSDFQINTTFNFYAGWWATWIMKDIQNNILKVEKYRAELSNE